MEVKLIRHTLDPDELAGIAAAKCTRSSNISSARDYAMKCGHESIAEHATMTFEINGVSRVLLAQLTRHRLASFSVESQRYCELFDRTEFVIPPRIAENMAMAKAYGETVNHCFLTYKMMVRSGIDPEDARYVIPQGVVTNLIMTMNIRELRHFVELRCCNRAQWEIRKMADEMLRLSSKAAPSLMADAGPGCIRGHCPEGKKCCGHPRNDEIAMSKQEQ